MRCFICIMHSMRVAYYDYLRFSFSSTYILKVDEARKDTLRNVKRKRGVHHCLSRYHVFRAWETRWANTRKLDADDEKQPCGKGRNRKATKGWSRPSFQASFFGASDARRYMRTVLCLLEGNVRGDCPIPLSREKLMDEMKKITKR